MNQFSRRTFLRQAGAISAAGVLSARTGILNATQPVQAAPFSWDRVPVYGHLGKSSGDFTSSELDFIARNFAVVTIEKGQAFNQRGSTEEGIYEAARQLKRRNPNLKVLFYWNSFINYPLYKALDRFQPEWRLRAKDGQLVTQGGNARPDLTLPEMREWWSDVAAAAMQQAPLDGIFADALPQALSPALARSIGRAKADAIVEGLQKMLSMTRDKMGKQYWLLANGLRSDDFQQLLDWECITGLMIERFGYFRTTSTKDMRADLESLEAGAKKGKLMALKCWPGFSWLDAEQMKASHARLLQRAQQQLTFPLACFLVAAQPGCFISYSWGYRESDGTLDDYPELHKSLGAPVASAQWRGDTATREFEHASVRVDLNSKDARIEWHSPDR